MPRLAILLPLAALLWSGTAVAADPVDALLTKAHAAERHGETELALRLTQSAIVADPSRPGSYIALGDLYAADHQPEAARTYYDEALLIDPADTTALKAVAALDRNALDRNAKSPSVVAGATAPVP